MAAQETLPLYSSVWEALWEEAQYLQAEELQEIRSKEERDIYFSSFGRTDTTGAFLNIGPSGRDVILFKQ